MGKIKTLKDGEYEYDESDLLGEGSFAIVYKGIITKNNRVIAVRLLPLNLIKQYGDKIKEIIRGEVGVLKDLSLSENPDTIFTTRIYDCFMTERNVVMILEYCPEGNLQDVLKKGPLPEKDALPIMYQLARGLQFIASEKVVHRDIKPDNVFVKREGSHKIFKLGDFGFAVKKQINQEIVGTPVFMSPQLFKEVKYGSEVDVWAFGLMAHYMLFKQFYFIGASEKAIKQKVLNEKYTLKKYHLDKITKEMADFLQKCLQMDKDRRMPANKISEHPVFDRVRPQIAEMVADVKLKSSQFESELVKNTAKGKMMNEIVKYSFLRDLAIILSKYDPYNLATLYIFKYNLGELADLRKKYENKMNMIEHQDWNKFVSSPDYERLAGLLKKVFKQNQENFENSFNSLIPLIEQRYGNNVAQGICANLGNGPMERINPKIPQHEITNSWIPKFMADKNPTNFELSLQCMMALAILENRPLDFDFTAFQMQKTNLTAQQKCELLEMGFKRSNIR